jgi:hypothetical protein
MNKTTDKQFSLSILCIQATTPKVQDMMELFKKKVVVQTRKSRILPVSHYNQKAQKILYTL